MKTREIKATNRVERKMKDKKKKDTINGSMQLILDIYNEFDMMPDYQQKDVVRQGTILTYTGVIESNNYSSYNYPFVRFNIFRDGKIIVNHKGFPLKNNVSVREAMQGLALYRAARPDRDLLRFKSTAFTKWSIRPKAENSIYLEYVYKKLFLGIIFRMDGRCDLTSKGFKLPHKTTKEPMTAFDIFMKKVSRSAKVNYGI